MSKHVDDERMLDEVVIQAQNKQKNKLDVPGYVGSDIDVAPIQYPQSVAAAPPKQKSEVAPSPAAQTATPVAQPKKSKRMWTTDFGEGLAKMASLMGMGLGDTDRREAREERRKARTARVNERIDARNLRREERAESQESKRVAREADRYARTAARTERVDARNAEREAAKAARMAARDERTENRAERIAERDAIRENNKAIRAEERAAREAERENARNIRISAREEARAERVAEQEANKAERLASRIQRAEDKAQLQAERAEEKAARVATRNEERNRRIEERANIRTERAEERAAREAEREAIERQRQLEREQERTLRANERAERAEDRYNQREERREQRADERAERLAERNLRRDEVAKERAAREKAREDARVLRAEENAANREARAAARVDRANAREERRNERLASKAINTDGLMDMEGAGIDVAPTPADVDKSKIDAYVPTYIPDEVKNKVAEQRRQEAEASDAKRKAYGQKLTDMVTPYMMGDQADAETINKSHSVYDIERERAKKRAEEAEREDHLSRLSVANSKYGVDKLFDNSGINSDGVAPIKDAEIIDQTIEEEAPMVSRRPSAGNTPASYSSGQEEEPMSITERQKMVASRTASDANTGGNRAVDDTDVTPKTESTDYEVARRERASEPVAVNTGEEVKPMSVDDRKRMVEARAASIDGSETQKSGEDSLGTSVGEVRSSDNSATPSAAPSGDTSAGAAGSATPVETNTASTAPSASSSEVTTGGGKAPAGASTTSTNGLVDKIDENIVPSVNDNITFKSLNDYAKSLYSESDRAADEKKKRAAQWVTAAQMLGDSIGALSNVYWTGKGANAMQVSPGAGKAAEATYQLNQDIRNAQQKAAKAKYDATLKKYEMEMQRNREKQQQSNWDKTFNANQEHRAQQQSNWDKTFNANEAQREVVNNQAEKRLKLDEARESRLKQQYGNGASSSKGNSREFTLNDGKSVSIDNFNDDKIYRLYESLPDDVRASYEKDAIGRSVRLNKDEMLDVIHRNSTDPRMASAIRKMAGMKTEETDPREEGDTTDFSQFKRK